MRKTTITILSPDAEADIFNADLRERLESFQRFHTGLRFDIAGPYNLIVGVPDRVLPQEPHLANFIGNMRDGFRVVDEDDAGREDDTVTPEHFL